MRIPARSTTHASEHRILLRPAERQSNWTLKEPYTSSYFAAFRSSSRKSAEVIVPILLGWIRPKSVIDIGCGVGEWLSVFQENGVEQILGVDGEYVLANSLAILRETFRVRDLTQPYETSLRFDLAISLEVAEHLPKESAEPCVRTLTKLALIIAFSAAIPFQPGVGHVNGQWPAYWAKLFAAADFLPIDALRSRIWDDSRIDYWYRQNILIYVSSNSLHDYPALNSLNCPTSDPLPRIHPRLVEDLIQWGTDWEKKYWDLWKRTEGVFN